MPTLTDRRIALLFLIFALALGAALLRAVWFGTVKAPALKRAAATQQVQTVELPAPRGTVTDRHGNVLAVSESASDVSATPYLVADPVATAEQLAPLLERDPLEIARKLDTRSGFVYLARRVPAARAKQIRALRLEGISLTPSSLRTYPRGWLASQVLGTASEDPGGGMGLEYAHDRVLRGRDGLRRIVSGALGQAISIEDVRPTVPGRDIRLTIDAAMQEKVESALEEVGRTYTPKSATAIVMDPQTSELLAIANWPRTDANNPGGAPLEALRNRAVADTYEPGSTFKAFTVAAALQDGTVTPATRIHLPTQLNIADRVLHDDHPRPEKTASVAEILAESSNIGAVKVALMMGAKRFDQWVRRFGFGRPTGVALPGEEIGIVPTYAQYSGSSIANLPIGQGQSVTPMQMVAAYAAIANGGILRPPRIVDAVDGVERPRERGRRILSPQTAAQVREMLRGVLAAGGTAAEAEIPGYDLAGKTGTSNKVDRTTGEYSKTDYWASFIGFAPASRPRLLVAIVVDEPRGSIYGGDVAAPAFQEIAAWALPYLGVKPH